MTTDQPDPAVQFAALLSRFPAAIVAHAEQCMTKLRRALPGALELVYDYSHSLVVGFGVSEHGYEAIVALAVHADRVLLYLDKSLPDPKGLLQGSGAKVRSVALATPADLDGADLRALVAAAIARSGATFSGGAGRMVIKTGANKTKAAKKQRPAVKESPKKKAAKKPAAKKTAAKKTAAKKTAAKKPAAKKTAKKAAARKPASPPPKHKRAGRTRRG